MGFIRIYLIEGCAVCFVCDEMPMYVVYFLHENYVKGREINTCELESDL